MISCIELGLWLIVRVLPLEIVIDRFSFISNLLVPEFNRISVFIDNVVVLGSRCNTSDLQITMNTTIMTILPANTTLIVSTKSTQERGDKSEGMRDNSLGFLSSSSFFLISFPPCAHVLSFSFSSVPLLLSDLLYKVCKRNTCVSMVCRHLCVSQIPQISVGRNTMSQTWLQGIPSTGSGIHHGR